MATQQTYAQGAVIMDGNPLTQITSFSLTWNRGNIRVDLLNEGIGGFTPGIGDCTLEVGFAVPIGGLEADYIEKLVDGSFVTMQVRLGASDFIGRGKIDPVSISQSVGASMEGSFTWVGELAKLQ